jgi:hypothetical protein
MATKKTQSAKGGTAFVICQVGDGDSAERRRADEVIEFIIEPVVKGEFGLEVLRSDRDPTPGQITSRIIGSLLEAELVIADLTGRNANVYYELGVAHSFRRPVVILVDKVSTLSFDTEHERVIPVGDDGTITARQAKAAKDDLRKAVKVALASGYKPSNLVTDVATARSLADIAPDNPMAAIAAELASMRAAFEELRAAIPSPNRFFTTPYSLYPSTAPVVGSVLSGFDPGLITNPIQGPILSGSLKVGDSVGESALSTLLRNATAQAVTQDSTPNVVAAPRREPAKTDRGRSILVRPAAVRSTRGRS